MSAAEAGCLGGLTLASLAGDSCWRFSRRLGGSQAADLQVQPSGGHALGADKGERRLTCVSKTSQLISIRIRRHPPAIRPAMHRGRPNLDFIALAIEGKKIGFEKVV